MSDVLVIGAGLSGMTSAIALAKAGRSVTLVEQARHTGPVIRSFRRGGCQFDCGFHYAGSLGKGEMLAEMLDYLGVYSKITPHALDPDGSDIIRIQEPSCQVPFPWGWEQLEDTLSHRFPTDAQAVWRYFEDVKRIYHQIPTGLISQSANFNDIWDEGMGPSLQEYLDSITSNQMLQRVLTAHTILYGMEPNETPFTIHARIMGSYYQSSYAIQGGGTALADAFSDRLAELGIEVICGAKVKQICFSSDGRARAVQLDVDREIEAQEFIYSGHPVHLSDLLPDGVGGRTGKRLRRLEDTASAIILFCTTDLPPKCLRDRNLFVRKGLDTAICRGDLPIADRSFFVSFSQPAGGSMDKSTFTVIFPESSAIVAPWQESNYGNRPPEYRRFKSELTGELLARLEDGCPELAGKVRVVDAGTPLTIRHYCSTPMTSGIYGVKHKCGRIPILPQSKIENLFITGQAVISPGLFGAVYSGLLTSGVMAGNECYRKELFQ